MNNMTIRQIAETAGCGLNTVRRISKMLYPNVKAPKNGRAIEYNKEQSIAIMDKLPKSNYVADPTQMVNQNGNLGKVSEVDYEVIGKMIAMAVSSAMQPLVNELKQTRQNAPLQLEHVPEIAPRKLFIKNIDQLVKISKTDHSTVYNRVYSEMGYLYGVKVKARAKKRNVRPIEVLETDNLMSKAVAVSRQMIEQVGE